MAGTTAAESAERDSTVVAMHCLLLFNLWAPTGQKQVGWAAEAG